jgi:hypothetical protein
LALVSAIAGVVFSAAAEEAMPKVRPERPRIWIRSTEWVGPSVPKLKEWFKLKEYQDRGVSQQRALQYVVNGDQEMGKAAVDWLLNSPISGSSPSYSGVQAQRLAAVYDWLRNHPAFTDEKRAKVVAELEKWGDDYLKYVTQGGSAIYYARYPGAISGLAHIGLALYGDSPKAEKYVAAGYKALLEYGLARQYEDGSTAGGTYSIHHAFPDLARAVLAFESATDAELLKTIREKQGNWLEGQLLWQIWETYPNGYFVKEGDLWQQPDSRQVRMQIDVLTTLLQNGYGRTHADLMHQRWGNGDYHSEYVWNFFVFNNPEIKPRPLEELGKAKRFGEESHGYVIFRDGWAEGSTHIFFRCGEGMDIHSNRGSGAFDIHRHRVLAQRANGDYPKEDDRIQYSNAMVFNDHDQPCMEMKPDVPLDFAAFLKTKTNRFECGDIVAFEATNEYARVKGDLTAAVKTDCKKWTRELVFLGYKVLLVLDQVETLDKPVVQKWQLHLAGEAKVDGKLATTVNGKGKLFCRTLLPADAVISGEKVNKYFRHVVSPKDDKQVKVTYLHVLYPTDAETEKMPECSVRQSGDALTAKVGELEYAFKGQ